MTNTTIIYNTVKAAFTPDQLTALIEKTCTPAQIAAYAADPALLAADDFHTFQAWKQMGYSVRKGEHAAMVAYLWKHGDGGTRKRQTEDGETDEIIPEGFYKCKSFLFHRLQVEKIS